MSQTLENADTGYAAFSREDIECSIVTHFEKQALESPAHAAALSPHGRLSYAELDRAANKLAHALLGRCGSDREPIPILMGHHTDALIGLLGIIKSSKPYVALDPWQTDAWTRSVLEDVDASIFLTDTANIEKAKRLAPAGVNIVEIGTALDSPVPEHRPDMPHTCDDLCAVLYTSGSTGRPKGVLQTHRSVLHRVWWEVHKFGMRRDDRMLQLAPFSAGASLRNIFTPLLTGATSCLFSVREHGLAALADWLVETRISIYHSVPTVFRNLTEVFSIEGLRPACRRVHLAGAPVTVLDVQRFREHFADDTLLVVSLSGTEMGALCQLEINPQTPIDDDIVPIGYPIQDKAIKLVDTTGLEVSSGDVGEIEVTSRFLSPGYWRNPELSVRCFAPTTDGETATTYRTGDLGRIRVDGAIEYLGRKDFQIKIGGQRVHTEAVEAVLLGHEGLREVAVIAHEIRPGDLQLVAHVVARSCSPPTSTVLREFCQAHLPAQAVPSSFVFLDSLPLLTSGKIDRNRLTLPSKLAGELPRTLTQKHIVAIWSEVLQTEDIGIHDEFLAIGGDSLLAMRILARIGHHFDIELPLFVLFECHTPAELAEVIDSLLNELASQK